jgi:hypothetical protein
MIQVRESPAEADPKEAVMSYPSVKLRKNLGDGAVLDVTAELHKLDGNPLAHFSLTVHAYRGRVDLYGGADHETALKHFPELAPIAALHLADENGVPMYAVENGAYWLGFTEYVDAEDLSTFARLWRITEAEAAAIRHACVGDADMVADAAERRAALRHQLLVHAERASARWGQEAADGIDLLQRLAEHPAAVR